MRRQVAWVVVTWLGLSSVGLAQRTSITYESLTVSTAAVALASATTDPSGQPQIGECVGRVETAAIRYRFDGTAPTASEGIILNANDTITITGHDIASAIQFIRDGGTNGTLKIHCWR